MKELFWFKPYKWGYNCKLRYAVGDRGIKLYEPSLEKLRGPGIFWLYVVGNNSTCPSIKYYLPLCIISIPPGFCHMTSHKHLSIGKSRQRVLNSLFSTLWSRLCIIAKESFLFFVISLNWSPNDNTIGFTVSSLPIL